jgi:hypothetical protein
MTTPTPQAQAFSALLTAALNGHPRVHLPPYRVPAPIVYTPEQTESEIRTANRFRDES